MWLKKRWRILCREFLDSAWCLTANCTFGRDLRVDRNLTCGREQRTKWVHVGGRRLVGGRRKGDGTSGWGLGQTRSRVAVSTAPQLEGPRPTALQQVGHGVGSKRGRGTLVWEQLSWGCSALHAAWLPFGRVHQPRGKVVSQDMALASGSPGQPPCPGGSPGQLFLSLKRQASGSPFLGTLL